jgi:hypothetical protein
MPPRESSPVKIANVAGRLSLVGDEGGIDVERASAGRFGPDLQAIYVGTMANRLIAPPA